MFNTTILFLSLSSFSKSPCLMIPFAHNTPKILLAKSIFSRFTNPFLRTYTNNHYTHIFDTTFKHFVSTPLIFDSECYFGSDHSFIENKPIIGIEFEPTQFDSTTKRVLLTSCSGNIVIIECQFIDLENTPNDLDVNDDIQCSGGGLFIGQNSAVELYNCLFSNCSSYDNGGAAYIAAKKLNTDKTQPNNFDKPLQKLNATYCCFQRCYFKKAGRYGTAMYISANKTHLSYTSTSQCPLENAELPNGAQFDMNSPDEITSSNVNTTGGQAQYCSAIEYRNAAQGYFKYQTVINITGKFATSFTNLKKDFEITDCNYVDNTIKYSGESDDNPALIHIRTYSVNITNFCFLKTKYEGTMKHDRFKIIGVNHGYDKSNKIILFNCFSDLESDAQVSEKFPSVDCIDIKGLENKPNQQIETFLISQLNLGECKGNKKPEPTMQTSIFSQSNYFTVSSDFTHSSEFIFTNKFTYSNEFTYSDHFSKSNIFSPALVPNKQDKGLGTGPIAGIVVGAVAAAAIIAGLIAFFVIKKRKLVDVTNEVVETNDSSITVDNNLQDIMEDDDPFAEEFNK